MTIPRSTPLHGTGHTVGEILDAAAQAGGGGGSPQPGQPTRFLTLTYHHPGNEDGNSIPITGIVFPDSTIAEGEVFRLNVQCRVVVSSSSEILAVGESPFAPPTGAVGRQCYVSRQPGGQPLIHSGNGDITSSNTCATAGPANPDASGDSQFYLPVIVVISGSLYASFGGMSTDTPTDWTINVQLTPIAP